MAVDLLSRPKICPATAPITAPVPAPFCSEDDVAQPVNKTATAQVATPMWVNRAFFRVMVIP
jgi:hypothetical protein